MFSAKRLSAMTFSAKRNVLWPIGWSLHWRNSHFPNGFPCIRTGRFHHNITRLFTRLLNEPVYLPLPMKKLQHCVTMKRFGLLPCNYRYLLSDFWMSEWDGKEWTESFWHLANCVWRMRDQQIFISLHINTLAVPQMGYKIVMEGMNIHVLSTLYVMICILL